MAALVAMNMVFGAAAEPVSGAGQAQAIAAYDAAVSAERAGDAQRAVKLYKQAISIDPGETCFYIGLGELYQHKNDLVSAEATYKVAMKFDPNNGLLQSAWANLLWAKGDTAESVRVWRKASPAVEKAQRESWTMAHRSGGNHGTGGLQPASATEIAFNARHQK